MPVSPSKSRSGDTMTGMPRRRAVAGVHPLAQSQGGMARYQIERQPQVLHGEVVQQAERGGVAGLRADLRTGHPASA